MLKMDIEVTEEKPSEKSVSQNEKTDGQTGENTTANEKMEDNSQSPNNKNTTSSNSNKPKPKKKNKNKKKK